MSVYFMQAVDGGPIKIGYSADPQRRRVILEARYGRSLIVLATMDGGREVERRVHAKFAHARLGNTEQFRPVPALFEFMGCQPRFDEHPDDVDRMRPIYKNLKISAHALRWARIASGFTGETVTQYISRVVKEAAIADIERGREVYSTADRPPSREE